MPASLAGFAQRCQNALWALLSPCPLAVSQQGWAVLWLGREQGGACSAPAGGTLGLAEWESPGFHLPHLFLHLQGSDKS